MDILGVLDAARKHWVLLTLGALLGVALSLASMLRPAAEGAGVEPRIAPTYTTTTRLLITEPNLDVARMNAEQGWPNGYTKTVFMAPTYAYLLLGDEVRERAESLAGPLDVKATAKPMKDTPVLVLRVSASDPQESTKAASAITRAFIAYIEKQQDDRSVPETERIRVAVLSAPTAPKQTSSSVLEMGALALVVPMLLSLGLAVSIESARQRRDDVSYGKRP